MRKNRKAAGKAPESKGNSSNNFKKSSPGNYRDNANKSKARRKPLEFSTPSSANKRRRPSKPTPQVIKDDNTMRLNKFLAHSGVCSRREADKYITAGLVQVNGEVVTELGTKVKISDNIKYGGESIRPEKPVYLLLNKPKDYITTMDDPQGRKTVSELVSNACKERVFPVGRLDRNTTGLLLLTNDGELAKKLTHPKHEIRKIYQVVLDKNVSAADLRKLVKGVQLEDGFVNVDVAAYVGDADSKKTIGVELHSGKNRVIRRLFEALGYKVVKLDRTVFAGLTKKSVPRGKYRFLNNKEVSQLKML